MNGLIRKVERPGERGQPQLPERGGATLPRAFGALLCRARSRPCRERTGVDGSASKHPSAFPEGGRQARAAAQNSALPGKSRGHFARTLAVWLFFPHSRLAVDTTLARASPPRTGEFRALKGRAMGIRVALTLVALSTLGRLAGAGCVEERRCCPGRDQTCTATGWRLDRTYGTCFCDEACEQTGDCCHDYAQACPAVSCVVGEWNHWSGCAEQCKPAFRMRTRIIQQEPKNGGEPCPLLEEKAGCLEYATHEGKDCGDVPAFITASEYSKERKNTAVHPRWSSETKDSRSYCVEFKTESLSPYCSMEIRPYARWMQYLRAGYTVCVMCQEPAMHRDSYRCPGDGTDTDRNTVLHWQAVGNPSCYGTWKKIQQVKECSCPLVHSFIFT